MSNSIISAIEDLIDELEDSAYNREESYKISKYRNKISFALNNFMEKDENEIKELAENRKIEKIYRLELDEYDMPTTYFYNSKSRALEDLEEFKEKITEEYLDNEVIDEGTMILLQEIDLNKSEDLYMHEKVQVVSELVMDESKNLIWKDYEVE